MPKYMPAVIAWRNLWGAKQRSLLLIGTLAFSIMMVVVVDSFMRGQQQAASRNQAAIRGGHVFITGRELSDSGKTLQLIRDTQRVQAAIASIAPQLVSTQLRNRQQVRVVFGSSTYQAQLVGIQFTKEAPLLTMLDWQAGSAEAVMAHKDSIIVRSSVVQALGLELGDVVTVQAHSITGQATVASLVLRGIVTTRDASLATTLADGYAHLTAVDALVALPAGAQAEYILRLKDVNDARELAHQLRNQLHVAKTRAETPTPPLAIAAQDVDVLSDYGFYLPSVPRIWQGTDVHIMTHGTGSDDAFSRLLQRLAWAVFGLLLAITMVGIANAYHMVMLERRAEIGIMRAMGAQRALIWRIFIVEALIIAAFAIVTGSVAACLLTLVLGQVPLPSSATSYNLVQGRLYLPIGREGIATIAMTAGLVLLATLLAVLAPAHAAARLEPRRAITR